MKKKENEIFVAINKTSAFVSDVRVCEGIEGEVG